MSLVSQTLGNLFNGVSQQPPALRAPSQAEASVNIDASVTEGLRLRAPTSHIARLFTGAGVSAAMHLIDRSPTDKWVVVVRAGSLRVFNAFTGAEATVSAPGGFAYLNAANSRDGYRLLTVADTTFVLNRERTVAVNQVAASPVLTAATVQRFSDLPATVNLTTRYRIQGDANNSFAAYWVRGVASNGTNVWEETTGADIWQIDAATMPHRLVRTGPTAFTFEPIPWEAMLVGDRSVTNAPSFNTKRINDLFFFRDRLGFITNENVVMSRAGRYFNLWPRSLLAVRDDDPIDVLIAHPRAPVLQHAVPFQSQLILFGDTVQFSLTPGDVLSPRAVRVDPTTEFEAGRAAKPVGLGPSLYFAVPRGDWSGVREYIVDRDTVTNDAPEVTQQCPSFVPANVHTLTASTNEDVVVAIADAAPASLFVYRTKFNGTERVQSAWQRWDFHTANATTLLGARFSEDRLFLLVSRDDGVHLESMRLAPRVGSDLVAQGARPFVLHLDRKLTATGVFDAANGWTTWTLPFDVATTVPVAVVAGGAFGTRAGTVLATSRPSATTVRAVGDWSAGSAFIGIRYTGVHTLSPIYLRDRNGAAILAGRLQLRTVDVLYRDSGSLRIRITRPGRGSTEVSTDGRLLGDPSAQLGTPMLASGSLRALVESRNEDARIEFVMPGPLPAAIQSAVWEGFYVNRARGV